MKNTITWQEKKELAEYLGVSPVAVHKYNPKKLELMILGIKVKNAKNYH
jgi:hypothetical protein